MSLVMPALYQKIIYDIAHRAIVKTIKAILNIVYFIGTPRQQNDLNPYIK